MTVVDREAAEQAIAAFLRALGHEPVGDLADTPALVAQAWSEELLDGYGVDPAVVLGAGAVPVGSDQSSIVVLRGLTVVTVCPHHLLPATGDGTVIYLPGDRVVGFGSIARALEALTRRLTFQERAGSEMAALMVDALGARGALCRLRLTHGCLSARGARQSNARVESIGLAGCYAAPGPERDAAFAALGDGRGYDSAR